MSRMSAVRSLPNLVAAFALGAFTACTSMPVTSMVRLIRTDFSTIDPAGLRVAVKLPQGVRPRRQGVRLRLTTTAKRTEQVEEFVLAELADPAELRSLQSEVSSGEAVYGFRLDQADLPRVSALRSELLARKARGEGGAIKIGVGADGCRTAALPATILLTTYLRTELKGDFFPLVRDVDVRKLAPGEDLAAKIPPCT